MPLRQRKLVVLFGLWGCARIVGLEELREEQRELQADEAGGVDAGGGVPSVPGSSASAGSAGGATVGPLPSDGSAGSGSAGSGSAGSGSADDPSTSNGSPGGGAPAGDELPSGMGGAGGEAGADTGPAGAGPGAAGAGPGAGAACDVAADCRDTPPCATAQCRDGACVATGFAILGTPCGSGVDGECTNPDTCDGQGICQSNDEIGTPCAGGTCAGGVCVVVPSGCVVDTVSSVPFSTSWSSVGRPDLYDGGCDTEGTPDYALVFTAPQNGIFRVTSAALVDAVPYTGPGEPSGVPDGPADGDSVLTVVRGACAGVDAQQLECNDDVAMGTLSSQLDIDLSAGEVVTVYLNELAQTGGGTGTVSITALP